MRRKGEQSINQSWSKWNVGINQIVTGFGESSQTHLLSDLQYQPLAS